jgi:C-22 sterol desaturase
VLPVLPSLCQTTIMASMFRILSASVSVPSPTSLAHFSNLQLPCLLTSVSNAATWTYTTLAIIFALLALEQSVYRYKKKHLPGDSWTIPIIGKFADSMKPTMEGYMKQWNSGALSALSVFNMLAHLNASLGLELINLQIYCDGF